MSEDDEKWVMPENMKKGLTAITVFVVVVVAAYILYRIVKNL